VALIIYLVRSLQKSRAIQRGFFVALRRLPQAVTARDGMI
jgi:hypothetical protein